MLTWYQSKVKYEQSVDGKIKTVSEAFIHEAVNFGEVEKHCYEQLTRRIKSPDVDAIAKAPFDEVIFFKGTSDSTIIGHPFYRVDLNWLDDKSSYLIPAKDPEQAIERALEYHGNAEAQHVTGVKKTEIQGVWHPNNELWQGDWRNRMELLLELGRHSYDINQTEIFDSEGKANDAGKSYSETRDKLAKEVDELAKTKKFKKGITFRNKNGDPIIPNDYKGSTDALEEMPLAQPNQS